MKLFLCFCLTFIVCSISFADEKLLELNAENLTQLALKNSSDQVLNDYALHILKTKRIKEYFKYRKDSKKINELIKRERRLIDDSLKDVAKSAKFIYKIKTNYHSYDNEKSIINLGNKFSGTKQAIFRSHDQFKGLPNYFILLISNLDSQNSIKVIKKNYNRRQDYLKKISQINDKGVYVEFVLSLQKYQNQQSFQAVIEKIDVYTLENKKSLLGTQIEMRDRNNLVNNWLLSEGFTNPLIGIHAFQFVHNRLQDQLSTNSNMSNFCKKTKKIGIHQVVVCTKYFSQNTDLIINYLGGKVAQIDLVAKNSISKSEIRTIQTNIKNYLKLPKLDIKYNVVKWSDFNVDFTLFSDAFNNKESERSNYKSIFEAEPVKTKRTLILTMMAQKTKALLSDLGVKL